MASETPNKAVRLNQTDLDEHQVEMADFGSRASAYSQLGEQHSKAVAYAANIRLRQDHDDRQTEFPEEGKAVRHLRETIAGDTKSLKTALEVYSVTLPPHELKKFNKAIGEEAEQMAASAKLAQRGF